MRTENELHSVHFLSAAGLVWRGALKKTTIRIDLLTDIDKLLMVENDIRGEICDTIYRYAKASNKYMEDYDKNKESSYLKYWDVNNLYVWVMSQTFPVYNFKWVEDISEFDQSFTKKFNKKSDEGYFLEVDIQYPENLRNLHNDLPFFQNRIKTEKVEKLVANLHNKNEHVSHIQNLKEALNYGLVLKKVRRAIKFNHKAWLKPCMDINTDLKSKK